MANNIKNMENLRDFAITALEKLARGEIGTEEAGVTGKLCESVISTVKSQLEYARMIQEKPQIPFLQDCHKQQGELLEHEGSAQKGLPSPTPIKRKY